jgi:hypothetical protein
MNGIAGSFAMFPNNAEEAAKVPWTGRENGLSECSLACAWHGHDAASSTKGALSSAASRLATAANRNGRSHRQGQSTRIRAPAALRTPPHYLQVERQIKAESALSNAHALGRSLRCNTPLHLLILLPPSCDCHHPIFLFHCCRA